MDPFVEVEQEAHISFLIALLLEGAIAAVIS